MATLSNSFPKQSDLTAVIIPGSPALTLSFSQLNAQISSFQQKLAHLGICHGAAVSIALPNSIEFIVRGIMSLSVSSSLIGVDIFSGYRLATRVSISISRFVLVDAQLTTIVELPLH
jgi:non-ribosomal peptide synthetase component E (peptide arylation enzyme)